MNINEVNFKVIVQLLNQKASFFKGLDLSNNPLFKETSLNNLFNLHKSPLTLQKSIATLPTRHLTFLSLEKTGLKSPITLTAFTTSIFITCPDIEILILNSLPITDKIVITLAKSIQKAVNSQFKLVKNLKEIGLANTRITDKGAMGILYTVMRCTQLEVINLEGNNKIGFNSASFILQQLILNPGKMKITLREVFLDYTKVS